MFAVTGDLREGLCWTFTQELFKLLQDNCQNSKLHGFNIQQRHYSLGYFRAI